MGQKSISQMPSVQFYKDRTKAKTMISMPDSISEKRLIFRYLLKTVIVMNINSKYLILVLSLQKY